jgi:hypothetical protein
MDELDLLKKDWNTQSEHRPYSAKDIYPMLHRKSFSIVKTLFYISIAELAFWIIINTIPYFSSQAYQNKLDNIYGKDFVFTGITILSYGIILFFIYLLFKAYKAISVTDSAKQLMESILKTRRIIKYYVLFNLIMAGASIIIALIYSITNDPQTAAIFKDFSYKQTTIAVAVAITFIGIFILIIWLFYRLIYGILLKRLNQNYKALKNIEA